MAHSACLTGAVFTLTSNDEKLLLICKVNKTIIRKMLCMKSHQETKDSQKGDGGIHIYSLHLL